MKSVIENIFYVLCAFKKVSERKYLRNEFDFWNVHRIMNTSGLLHLVSEATLTLQETQSTLDSMNIPKIECIAYIYILL